jgi:hypothetical protein
LVIQSMKIENPLEHCSFVKCANVLRKKGSKGSHQKHEHYSEKDTLGT